MRRKHRGVVQNLAEAKWMFYVQLSAIVKNKAAMVIIIGLCILPSLYAWFNIAANWNPYGNTQGLSVAVANEDKGGTLEALQINIGRSIVDALKDDTNIGWKFVDKKEALDGVRDGTYYAAIVIPEDFSEKLVGVGKGHAEKGEIEYYVNEKINAISPKVTGAGMNTLEEEINKNFIRTVSETVLGALKVLDGKYEAYRPELLNFLDTMDLSVHNMDLFIQSLDQFYASADALDQTLKDTQSALPKAQEGIEKAMDLTTQGQNAVRDAKSGLASVRDVMSAEVNSLPALAGRIDRDLKKVGNLSSDNPSRIKATLQDVIDRTMALRQSVLNVKKSIDRLNDLLPLRSKILDAFSAKLARIEGALENAAATADDAKKLIEGGEAITDDMKEALSDAGDRLVQATDDAVEHYNNAASVDLGAVGDSLNQTLDATNQTLASLSNLLPDINRVLADAYSAGQSGKDSLNGLSKNLEATRGVLAQSTQNIRRLTDDEKFRKALELIESDVAKQSDFLSQPTVLSTHAVFPVPNYGSAMTPFYTILACWVGGLLMASVVSPINVRALDIEPNATLLSMYISRGGLFLFVAVVQALVLALGDLFLLGSYALHPMGFVATIVFASIVFSWLIYSLVFVFRDIGKALAIVLLVLQIAASGGTFPIEMTPGFFQRIHPFLPFTYAIGALREVQFGILRPHLTQNLATLLLWPFLATVLVLVAGPKLIRIIEKNERSMKKSGLH